ncbi:MAG: type I restriction-modification system subunit M, partial [Faecalibacillus faecis]
DEYLEEISKGLGYAIVPEYRWESIVSKINNHKIKASDFQDIFDSFNINAKRNPIAENDFANVFSDVNLGDTRLGSSTNERAKALNDIVLMIDDFNFKDDSGHDILGDVYEYLIGQFAANAGKKGGEFYTPHEISQVLAKLVSYNVKESDEQFRVYDPTMGSGSLLLTVQKELLIMIKGSVMFYGQELNTTTYNLARMNLMMHGVNYRNMELRRADTLDGDWPFAEKDGVQTPLKFDAVVANPPYSQKWDIKSISREKDPRFSNFGVAPASKADYAFVLHGLYHLEKTGTMAIVLPHGVLFRGSSEGKIRKNIIDENLLDAVIGMPANLFFGTSIPTCILVFKAEMQGEIVKIFYLLMLLKNLLKKKIKIS